MSERGAVARVLAFVALSWSSSACRATRPDGAPSPMPSPSAPALVVPAAPVPAAPVPIATVSAVVPRDVEAPPADARREACGSTSRLLAPGTGTQRPSDDDRVLLEYATFARSGRALDSSRAHGEPTVESVRNLSPGLACVVKRMSVGESRRVWVPAALQPMDQEEPNDVAPVDLTIDITLRELTRAPQRPDDYAAPPRAAHRTATGLSYRHLRRGSGQRRPAANSRVTIYHSGWTSRGVLFESSALAGQPASYLTYELPSGLGEGVQLMHVGDKVRFWLPERLAYAGAHRSAVKGPVVFDVELLAID